MTGLFGAFLVEVALISYRSVASGRVKVPDAAPISLPLPSEYTAAILVYGGLSFLPKASAPLPALIGWGVVVATLLNLWQPGNSVKPAPAKPITGTLPRPKVSFT